MANPLLARSKPSWMAKASPVLPVVLAILLVWGSIGAHLWVEYNQAYDGAIEDTGNLARGFAENVSRTIEGVDELLKVLRNVKQSDPEHFDLRRLAPEDLKDPNLTFVLSTTDRDGNITDINQTMAGAVNVSDRAHFIAQRDSLDDNLGISSPVLARVMKQWSILFTRKILDKSGKFDGIIIAGFDPAVLSRFYESLDIGHGNILLVGLNDGLVRARAPSGDRSVGTVANAETIAELKKGAPSGSYTGNNRLNGSALIRSYRRLDKYDLAVIVGLAESEVFAHFYRDLNVSIFVGIGLTALISLVGGNLARQRRNLINAQDQLSAAMENIGQGIMMADRAGQVQVINRRAVELLGVPLGIVERGLTTRDLLDWQLAHNEFPAEPVQTSGGEADLRQAARDGRMLLDTYERTRPNGLTLEVRTQALPNGGLVRSFTDITERKRTELALSSARDAAEAASAARSSFLAVVSHEIRTPLNGVIGMAGLLLDGKLPDRERRFAETLREAAENLLRLINDILDFSKLEANRLTLENIPFNLDLVIGGAIELQEAKAASGGLYLRTSVAPDVPRGLRGDPGRLRQILLNLIDNGLKFTKNGGVEVRVTNRGGVRPRLRFAVTDTGIGIAPEDQSRLFQHFAQVDSSTSRQFGGTGLGLAICRRLVQQMGGEISIRSSLGQGATFAFEIALDVDEAPQAVPAPPIASLGRAADGRKLRILLAEDNLTNRTVAIYWLESLGHTVDAVINGNEAVEAVMHTSYDLVLMDVMMPEKDGLAATREIRAMAEPISRLPIVAVTANAFQQHIDSCRLAGMDDFLSKPIITQELFAIVQRAIDGTLRHAA